MSNSEFNTYKLKPGQKFDFKEFKNAKKFRNESKPKKGSKAANRRKSFCARMGGMKKRLTSAKTAHDPDSRINKALRKWNC